jgi:hypothetical protein
MNNKDEFYVNNEEFYKLLCENKKIVKEYFKEDIDNIDYEKIKVDMHEKITNKILTRLFKSSKNKLYQNHSYSRLQNKLGRIFLAICKGLLTKPNFINYTPDWKDDMISEATFHMSRYVLSFDLKQTNPFAYFTTVCNNAFLQYLIKQNKYTDKFQPLIYIENMHNKDNHNIEELD